MNCTGTILLCIHIVALLTGSGPTGPIIAGPIIGLLLLACGGGENCSDADLPEVHDVTLSDTLPSSKLSTLDN